MAGNHFENEFLETKTVKGLLLISDIGAKLRRALAVGLMNENRNPSAK
jgi:hypothetical protein